MDRKVHQRFRGEKRGEESVRKCVRNASAVLSEKDESVRMCVKSVSAGISEDSGNSSLNTSSTDSRRFVRSCENISKDN